jgi:hypothetical protein
MTHTHTLTRTYTHLLLCHGHTLFIVTDAHQHMDRGLYTYMTSYLAQSYRLSILIDKPTLFINSWLIRLWIDNVLLISTRILSIVIDKPIPLSIAISMSLIVVNNIIVKKLSLKWNHLIWTPLNSTTFVTDEQNEFSLCPAEGESNLVAPKQHIFLTLLTEDEASK